MIKNKYYSSPIGILEILFSEEGILKITIVDNIPNNYIEDKKNDIGEKAISQLKEYFQGIRKEFDLPLIIKETDFQKRVWKELQNIKFGEIKTYEEISKKIGNPKAYRAVGNANNKNQFIIIIPCHRVVGKNKSSGGYAFGMDIKNKLLDFEKNINKKRS